MASGTDSSEPDELANRQPVHRQPAHKQPAAHRQTGAHKVTSTLDAPVEAVSAHGAEVRDAGRDAAPASEGAPASGLPGATGEAPPAAVQAARGALFIACAKAFFMVAGVAQRVLLGRLVDPAAYGAFSHVNGVISSLNNTMVQGTVQAISRHTASGQASSEAVRRAGLRLMAVVGGLAGAAVVLCAPALVRLFNLADYYVPWFRLVAAIPFVYSLYAVFIGSINGQRRFRLQAAFDMGFSLLKTTLLLAGAWLAMRAGDPRSGVTGAFAGFVGAAVVILLIAVWVVGSPLRRREAGARLAALSLLPFMLGVMGYAALINLTLNYDLWWLRFFAGARLVDAQADALAGAYEAVRTVALLPYQGLIVLTFIIFPLVSRATFQEDAAATAAYIRQAVRVAILAAAGVGLVLSVQPQFVLGLFYSEAYLLGVSALPVLLFGQCSLAVLGIVCAIVNASGRPAVAMALMGFTVLVGSVGSGLTVPGAAADSEMLVRQALATSVGMVAGLVAALAYLRKRFSAGPPFASVVRALGAACGALVLTRGVALLVPIGPSSWPRVFGLFSVAAAGIFYLALLAVLGEFSATDRHTLRQALSRRLKAS